MPKTFFTVFHTEADQGVVYGEMGRVFIDGSTASVRIYEQTIEATPTFKYLGIHIDEFGSPHAQIAVRLRALQQSIAAFWAGVWKIPACPHSFLKCLWGCLVTPVVPYGLEAYAWTETDMAPLFKCQTQAWRRLVGVGGRAPADAVHTILAIDCFTLTSRVRRVALFLRLLNSPEGSMQQIALITLESTQAPWFCAALHDL